jgi:hypothetical protein
LHVEEEVYSGSSEMSRIWKAVEGRLVRGA